MVRTLKMVKMSRMEIRMKKIKAQKFYLIIFELGLCKMRLDKDYYSALALGKYDSINQRNHLKFVDLSKKAKIFYQISC